MFLHAAGYRFFELENPKVIRPLVKKRAKDLSLKGTVLMAPEGVNLCLSGENANIRAFQDLTTPNIRADELDHNTAEFRETARSI